MSGFFRDRKKLFSEEEAREKAAQPASGQIDKKMLIWAIAATLLFTFPGVFGLILTLAAWKAKNRLQEEKCLFFAKLCNILATILGLFYLFITSLP